MKTTSFKPVYASPQALADLFLGFPFSYSVASGSMSAIVRYVAPLDIADQGAFSFLSKASLRDQLIVSKASLVVLTQDDYNWLLTQNIDKADSQTTTYVICSQPYAAYAFVAQKLYIRHDVQAGIHQSAVVDSTAIVDSTAQVGAQVVIGARVRIGKNTRLSAGVVIGDDVVIGNETLIHPNVTIYNGCEVGERCIIHAGAVIGSDGFGFAPSPSGWHKIPQVGRVMIGNNVEVGANTTIDRGALNDTVIHEGVKLDNQIQIAHNCEIGKNTAVASCVGIAGSTKIGENCMIGGAAMIGGHLSVVDGTVISAATAVPSSIDVAGQYSGVFPPMLHRDWERNASLIRHLSDLRKRLRALEKSSK